MAHELLTSEQMAEADRLTIEGGVPGYDLMCAAGQGVAEVIMNRFEPRSTLVLCGPGNNGGDGLVIARFLRDRGWPVRAACLVPFAKLRGDAAKAAEDWGGAVESFGALDWDANDLVIDAVFGTGFSRTFEGAVLSVFQNLEKKDNDVIAVDIPSGVNGSTGDVVKYSPHAFLTVTFCRKKIGHVLLPGKTHCGEVISIDIGIPDSNVTKTGVQIQENHPDLWLDQVPRKSEERHKYDDGHLVVFGGVRMTGAACLAAGAAMRIGTGLCTITGPVDTSEIYRTFKPHILFEERDNTVSFSSHYEDKRRNAVLIGPGAGLEDEKGLRQAVLDACVSGKACVFDADALSVFKNDPVPFFVALKENGRSVLTPHEGEFSRLFPDAKGNKVERCLLATQQAQCVILLKGSDTVIATPQGQAVVNTNAPATLATAGSGDVLAGMIAGLLARGVTPFESACAGAWIHGAAASRFGPGLISPDLLDEIPPVLREIT